MSTTVETPGGPSVQRGAEVARDLGWPPDRIGLAGAFAGLFDVGAPHWKRRHAATRMHRRDSQLNANIRVHMLRRAKSLSKP